MKDYSKGKIYCIRSFQTDKVYIGSTIQTLAQRLAKHRTNYKLYLNGKKKSITRSVELLKYDDYYIELIKLYPCSCREELVAEEGKYIRKWDCVNKVIPGRTQEDYYIDNKEQITEYQREYQREYRNKNKERIREKKKEYYIDNKENKLEQMKQYYNKNKEQIIEQNKQYYSKNKQQIAEKRKVKITCDCGSDVTIYHYKRHTRSIKHINWVNNNI